MFPGNENVRRLSADSDLRRRQSDQSKGKPANRGDCRSNGFRCGGFSTPAQITRRDAGGTLFLCSYRLGCVPDNRFRESTDRGRLTGRFSEQSRGFTKTESDLQSQGDNDQQRKTSPAIARSGLVRKIFQGSQVSAHWAVEANLRTTTFYGTHASCVFFMPRPPGAAEMAARYVGRADPFVRSD